MAEAQKKGRAGARGRQFKQMSNTAEEGELCLYHGHSLGRFSATSMRYDSHQACVRCVAGAREGRISLRLDTLLKKAKIKALKFWSQVDITTPDECWNWEGNINPKTGQPQFAWRRHGLSSSTQHHPQRVAMWFSWGDLGYASVKTTCGNKYCCNPFHLIPQHLGVFVDNDAHLDSFDLAMEIHTLKQEVQDYLIEESMKIQQRLDESAMIDAHADLILNPNTEYADRYESVMMDMLAGRHISQTEPEDPGAYRQPVDNDGEDEHQEHDF